MKRINNLYSSIISIENLQLADAIAQLGKKDQRGVQLHNRNAFVNISLLHESLVEKKYKTSPYTRFFIRDPKEREIFRLPYYPDRIVHHAIMNILEEHFVKMFTADTYSCIKGRGVHLAVRKLHAAMRKDVSGTQYCLKLDIRKFYPSVDHDILKQLLRRKFKDADLLSLLDEIIDSAPGLPIGNYLSQYLSNFYLTYFDHWLKEDQSVKYYFRYADDMVILSDNKPYLHSKLAVIREYLSRNLKLEVKGNYQVFPVEDRGIDFGGYHIYHKYILLRKSNKKRFARAVAKGKGRDSIASYLGWAKHCNSKNLIKKLLHEV